MTTIIRSIDINAPREAIRPYYAHPAHTPTWSHILTVWEPEAAWPSPGATARMGVKSGGLNLEGVATTLAYDDATMAHHFRHEPDNQMMAPYDTWFTFDEKDGKTTVTQKLEYTIPGNLLGKALDKLFVERQNARDIEQQLANLKALVERHAA
ncbi:MAG: SRPBCC family protein [Anaerolineales bacterium]|nr:SRPBCC family protein [Anaerolineales bacterium]